MQGVSSVDVYSDVPSNALYSMSYEEALVLLQESEKEELLAPFFVGESSRILRASYAIEAYARESFTPKRSLFESLVEFMGRIYTDFEFVVGISDVNTSVEEIFKNKKGVCQDFAHFAIAALRAIGLPARYMSGYIETVPQDGVEKLFWCRRCMHGYRFIFLV